MSDTPPRERSTMSEEDWTYLGYEVQDLFSPAAPINEADLIAGRSAQIERLTGAVFERGRHAVLFGERGVGKTSLATTLHALLPRRGRRQFLAVRKPANPSDDFSTLWRRVFNEIPLETGQRVGEFYPGPIGPDDIVRELSAISPNVTPIIIIDEFDKLSDDDAKRLTTHTIKALSDDAVNTTVILVGVADDISLLVQEHESIKRNIIEIPMPRMSADEMGEILDQRYPKVGMTISDGARARILTLSRGLPEYVHYLGREAAISAIKARNLDIDCTDLDHAISAMMTGSDHTLRDSYNKAVLSNKRNNLYRHVLLACALANTDGLGQFIPSDVLFPLRDILRRDIKIANFFPHIEGFCGSERGAVLEKKGSPRAYKYRFREPQMQPYVIMKGIADKLISGDDLPRSR